LIQNVVGTEPNLIAKSFFETLRKAAEVVGVELVKRVEWKALDEIFTIRNGYTPSKAKQEFWTNGTIPWFRMDDIRENGGILEDSIQHITEDAVKGKLFSSNSIIMATTATIGVHAMVTKKYLANQRFTNFTVSKILNYKLNSKFIYYYFFIIDEWCKRNTKVSNFPAVNMDLLKKQLFPLPPLSVQNYIVEKLDKFDTLVNDISTGLPREIELRKKQYEYFREELLKFDRKG
jgi:restriction modification system DNA specificity domain protein